MVQATDTADQFGRWQPIEMAPKDGTEILALVKWPFQMDVQRRIIYWSHSGNCVISAYLNTWMCAVTTISQREDYILGWTPLPLAPEADAEVTP